MGRSTSTLSSKPKSRRMNPLWRGVGCVTVLALTVGAYFLGGLLLDAYQRNPFTPLRVTDDLGFTVGPIDLPVGIAAASSTRSPKERVVTVGSVELKVGTLEFYVSGMQLAMAAIVDVVVWGAFLIVYSRLNPVKLGPTDAPPVYPKKGRGKNLVR